MALPKTTLDRIKADAEKLYPLIGDVKKKIGYIAGATAEAERAQKLVEALSSAITKTKECEAIYNVPCGAVILMCESKLQQCNAGKEVDNDIH